MMPALNISIFSLYKFEAFSNLSTSGAIYPGVPNNL